MPKLLLLEDDPAIASTVVFALERSGYEVTHCVLLSEAAARLNEKTQTSEPIAAAILDIGLPDGSGLDLCRSLRANAKTAQLPILILSAQSEEFDKILGLELGADDYLAKPFSPRELVARMNALLRRTKAPTEFSTGLVIDAQGQTAQLGGAVLDLTRLEFALLLALFESAGRIRSREQLTFAAWGKHSDGDSRSLDTHIKTLRSKIAQVDSREWVITHRGMGYSLARH